MSVLDGEAALTLTGQPYFLDMVPNTRRNELDFFPFPIIGPYVPLGETSSIVLVAKLCSGRIPMRSRWA